MKRKEAKAALSDAKTDSRISSVLPVIYEAATNHSRWSDALAQIVRLLGGNSGLIFSHQATPEKQGLWVPYQCSEEAMKHYAEHYYRHDIWMQRGHELGVFWPGNVITSDDLVPRQEFLSSIFFREFLSKQDIHDLCCGVLHDGSELDIPTVHIAAYRSLSMPVFSETEKTLLHALIPHLQAATRIGFRLGAAEQRERVMSTIAEIIAPPLILLNSQSQVLFANDAAKTLLKASKMLHIEAGRLVSEIRHQTKLDALLGNASQEEGALGLPHPSRAHKLWLIREPIAQAKDAPPDARRPAMALLIHDPLQTGEIDFKSFAKANDLTRAETRLARLLLEHGQLPPIAEELGLSVHTIRTQLRAICEKTGAERQTKLVKMLMSWPIRIGQNLPLP